MLDDRVGVLECGTPCPEGLGLEVRFRLIG